MRSSSGDSVRCEFLQYLAQDKSFRTCKGFIKQGRWAVDFSIYEPYTVSGPHTLPDGTWSGEMDPDSSVDDCAAQACYGCYCKNMDEQPFCQKYNEDEQEKLKLTAAIIAVSVCTNVVLKVLITQVTKFEGCHTSTEEEISTAIKIFVALLINAAVLPICLYADLSEFSWIPFVFDGVYSDATGEWTRTWATLFRRRRSSTPSRSPSRQCPSLCCGTCSAGR